MKLNQDQAKGLQYISREHKVWWIAAKESRGGLTILVNRSWTITEWGKDKE
eukprot:c37718_g1_i1 orf=262-414(+)